MALPDTMPLVLSRTYRPNDVVGRPFGVGSTHPYQMMIVGDNGSTSPSFGELVLPDGGRIRYERTNPGSTPYTFEHTATPTRFYKSTLTAVSRGLIGGWDIGPEGSAAGVGKGNTRPDQISTQARTRSIAVSAFCQE